MTMPRSAPKQPPPGLGHYPRNGALAKKEDNITLLRFVRKTLGVRFWEPDPYEDLTPEAYRNPAVSGSRKPKPKLRPDSLQEAKRAADRGDIEPLRKLHPEIADYIAPPKRRQGYPQKRKLPNPHKVPPDLVSLVHDINKLLRSHFTPTERQAWWSAEHLAIMILFGKEEAPLEWDEWFEPLRRLVEHGEEKRKRRLSTSNTK